MNRPPFQYSASRHSLSILVIVALVGSAATHAAAQSPVMPPPQRVTYIDDDDRSGPRLGLAYLFGGSVTADSANKRFSPFTTLFGWQFEHQFDVGPDMPALMSELILLVGGIEQNVPLPSASFLLGIRQHNGVEFGVGPTITGAGTQVVVAGGITWQTAKLNFPVNLAVAPGGQKGVSVSITTGFNYK